ncbi:hypothetical protein HID58_081593 [Brassica napus]|uniref:DUF220 domain-containing protein n=1 Tax=Brassica napus TaxID=3708 RepID=A0ABQ7Y880_BRANA|nr:hypothetical protein HID58_081593 [Brassica napus]
MILFKSLLKKSLMEKTGVRFVNMFKNNDVFPGFVVWINQTIQEPLKNVKEHSLVKTLETEIETTHDQNRDEEKLEKQLQAWRNNPSWIDQPPKVQRLVVAGKRRRWKQSGSMLRAKSKGSENVESKLVSEKDTNSNALANKKKNRKEHYDEKEERIQHILWHEEEKKHPWKNPPPKVKVTTKKGVYHMNLEMTIGAAPELTYLWLIDSWGSHFYDEKKRRDLMKNISIKVLTEDGPRRVIKVEKAVVYDFFSLTSIPIPLHLIVEENEKDLTGKYKKEKVMLMKVFEGNYKLEPVYVDQERLCKKRLPKSQEEYKKCSGGQGKIATKLIINQYFEPYPPFNLPPLSWYIRGNTIKTSKNLLNALQDTAKIIRSTKG